MGGVLAGLAGGGGLQVRLTGDRGLCNGVIVQVGLDWGLQAAARVIQHTGAGPHPGPGAGP